MSYASRLHRSVRDGTKQVVVVAAEFVFEGTGDHEGKISVEREKVALCCRGKVCGCVDCLSLRRNAEFIDTVIILTRTFELVERASFVCTDLKQHAWCVDRVALADQSRFTRTKTLSSLANQVPSPALNS